MRPIHPLCLALLVLVLGAIAPAPASAQNRVNDLLRLQLRQQGAPEADIARYVAFYAGTDRLLRPGIVHSFGGFTTTAQPRQTMMAIRLFNETSFAFCYRAKAELISGPLVGSKRNGRLGVNVLLDPGQNEIVLVHVLPRYTGGEGMGLASVAYAFWLAAPTGTARRCADNAPPDIDEWTKLPLDRTPGIRFLMTPEMKRRFAAAGPSLPVPAILRASAAAPDWRAIAAASRR